MSDEKRQNLTPQQGKVINAVLSARNITEGLKKVKVSRDTFYRWLDDTLFKEEYNRQRRMLISIAFDELKAATGEAAKALRELLDSQNEGIRLKASSLILDNIIKVQEIEELESRILKLEQNLDDD